MSSPNPTVMQPTVKVCRLTKKNSATKIPPEDVKRGKINEDIQCKFIAQAKTEKKQNAMVSVGSKTRAMKCTADRNAHADAVSKKYSGRLAGSHVDSSFFFLT